MDEETTSFWYSSGMAVACICHRRYIVILTHNHFIQKAGVGNSHHKQEKDNIQQ